MPASWINRAKLIPPDARAWRLERQFFPPGATRPAATLFVAGAGYGKSMAMLELATAAPDAPVVWYTLDPADADPATFFFYLVEGMRAHIPRFGTEIEALVAGGKLEPRPLWQHFFAALAAYNLPGLVLALDDFHHLIEADAALARELGAWLDKLPPGVQVLVATRRKPSFPTARLVASGRLAVIEQPRLAFTPAEEAAFWQQRLGRAAASGVRERLEGWPLGLALLADAGDGAVGLAEGSHAQVMAYVAEELYALQPADRRAFLLRASLLDELGAARFERAFDLPEAVTTLAALEAEHLVERLASRTVPAYRLPAYLRAFLASELETNVPAATRRDWQRRVAALETADGRPEAALPHWIAAEAWEEAVAAAHLAFTTMRFDGRQALIAARLEAFPAAVREREPQLQLWTGNLRARAGHHAEGIEAFERAEALFAARADAAGCFKARVCLANIALLRDDMAAFEGHLAAAEALEATGHAPDRADLWLVRALAAEQAGDMAGMRAGNEAALAVPVGDDVEVAASHSIALMNLYTVALHQGDLARAARHVERALETATRWHFQAFEAFARFLAAHLCLVRDDLEGASAALAALPPVWTELLDWHDLACAHAILAHYHQLQEAWKDAEDALQRSLSIFERADFRLGTLMAAERRLWIALQRKQYARVEERLAELGELGMQSIYELAPRLPAARARHLAGDPAGALALLEPVLAPLALKGHHLLWTRARLFEAAACLRRGDAARAREAHASAMAALEAHELGFLRTQDRGLWDELAPLAAPVAAGAVAVGAPALPVVAPLEVQLFGHLEVRQGGVRLDQWPRRKSKLLLAALALAPRGVPGFELGELLAKGDLPSANILGVNLFALRRVLEPALAKGARSAYVLAADDRYMLAEATLASLDVRAFDAALEAGDRARAADPAGAARHYEEALGHYRGNLLEDPFLLPYFEAEREAYRRRALGALAWLAEHHHARYDNARAEALVRRAIALAPAEEDFYLALMRQFVLARRLEAIKQVYWDCRKALKAHLGTAPGPAVERAYREALATFGERVR